MRTVGIDLGTTNTVAAIDATVLQHTAGLEESPILPSVVSFPPSGATLVGVTARNRRAIDPKNTISSAKRLMGQRWLSYSATQFRKQHAFDLVETADGACAFSTRAGQLTPVEIASRLIDKTFAAQQALRGDSRVVITVPAAFEAEARKATLEAARLAGLRDITIVEEPIATALAYTTLRNARAGRAVVYDLGGGTFDLAIVDCQTRPARVISHAGDPYLGGDDVDYALAGWAAQMVLAQYKWDLRSSPEVFDRLLVQCERAKLRLAISASTRIPLAQVDPAAPAAAESVTVTRATLEHLAQVLVQRTFLLCDEVLRDAGLRPSEIDTVYLAGGATLMPLVRDGVARYFSTLPHCEFDPMEVVAIGASLLPEKS